MKTDFQAVVIGGGPAGTTAARFASIEGAKVLLAERKREFGVPTRCAEGVGEVGLKEFLEPDPAFISRRLKGARLISPDGTAVELTVEGSGFILERKIFDRKLAELAGEAGTEIWLNSQVTAIERAREGSWSVRISGNKTEKRVTTEVIIAADGVESRVGRWAGLRTALSLHNIESGMQYQICDESADQDFTEFYFGENVAPGGYLWCFPKGEGLASVGVGIAADHLSGRTAKAFLDDFLKIRFPKAKILSMVAGGIPVSSTLKEIVGDGIMLVGDAARQVNPMTGAGILNGMIAGKLAGQVAVSAIKDGDTSKNRLKEYQKLWYQRLGRTHRAFYLIKEGVIRLSDEALNRTAHLLWDLPPDKRTLKRVFFTALSREPKLLLELRHLFG
jgi:digeranylgeranylglycerophospholipid reductase